MIVIAILSLEAIQVASFCEHRSGNRKNETRKTRESRGEQQVHVDGKRSQNAAVVHVDVFFSSAGRDRERNSIEPQWNIDRFGEEGSREDSRRRNH